jgi:hypothetical protein
MIKNRLFLNRYLLLLVIIFLTSSCSPQPEPTPFRLPTSIPPIQPLATSTTIPTIVVTSSPTEIILTPSIDESCTNALSFLDDITIEDGTTFSANTSIDKQWLVKNDGTCDWDATYKLKWVGGDPMSVNTEQSLYPARAGTQATLRIIFTAPTTAGEYESAWQATDPDGNFFGDLVFIKIVVQ